jgi:hypothetical protein
MSSHVVQFGFFNTTRNEEATDALEDTHFTENGKSKNKQVKNEGSDDGLLQHQRRNYD